jgi:hypothetical protein
VATCALKRGVHHFPTQFTLELCKWDLLQRIALENVNTFQQKMKTKYQNLACSRPGRRLSKALQIRPGAGVSQVTDNTHTTMRMQWLIFAGVVLALLSILDSQLATAFAQGSLAPPGPPAPMMKSLDQIEPRTPISSAPFTISQPGSYYLTTNLTVNSGDAIIIATSGVTLDLNGFTISSTVSNAAGTGILLNSGSLRNITIANGFVQGGVTNDGTGVYSGSGFSSGIEYSSLPAPVNVMVSRVSVSGCLNDGIVLGSLGESTVVESCTVRTVGGYGIYASTVKQSSAIDCGSDAISGSQVSDCRGESSGGVGVNATSAQNCFGSSGGSVAGVIADIALNCRGYSYSGNGVWVTSAQNCFGYSYGSGYGVYANSAHNCTGISAGSGFACGVRAIYTAENCYGSSGGYGLLAGTAHNCYGSCNSVGIGLSADDAHNCSGTSGGTGVLATTAENCYGRATGDAADDVGLRAETALNCYGKGHGSYGIYATGIAIGCSAVSDTGTALYAYIANSCLAASQSIIYKYNMP